jgi:hypothetical protein
MLNTKVKIEINKARFSALASTSLRPSPEGSNDVLVVAASEVDGWGQVTHSACSVATATGRSTARPGLPCVHK